MPSQRMERVDKLLRSEISRILQRKLKDPRVGMVTVTRVETAPDLRSARVHVSVYGDEDEWAECLAGLRSAAGFIRSELMAALHLRPMPSLEFVPDESLRLGARTLDFMDRMREEQPDEEPRSEGSDSSDSDE